MNIHTNSFEETECAFFECHPASIVTKKNDQNVVLVCVGFFFLVFFAFVNLHFRVYITFWPSNTLWFAASGGTDLCFAYVTLALGVSFAIRSFRDH